MTTFTTDDRLHAEKDGSFTIDCRQKPLTNDQILAICIDNGLKFCPNWGTASTGNVQVMQVIRAIEKAHGIG